VNFHLEVLVEKCEFSVPIAALAHSVPDLGHYANVWRDITTTIREQTHMLASLEWRARFRN